MDALSDVLRVIRLSGGVFLEAQFTAPWCINGRISPEDCAAFQVLPRHVITSHFVASGQMQLRVGDEVLNVRAGELVLLPHNDVHIFGSELGVAPISARDVIQPAPAGDLMRIVHGGDGEMTQVLCGFLGTNNSFGPLLSSLPSVLKLDLRATPSGSWIESSFRFAISQIAAGRVGSTTVIAKLSELLFVEAVSHYIAGLPDDRQGWRRACAIRTSAARSLCCTRAPRRHGARSRLPPRWACRDRASLSDSRHWSASRPCSTSLLAHAARGATAT